jgi:hypothetical protein
VPFPSRLTVLGISPSSGFTRSPTDAPLPCTPVLIRLAGVLPEDLAGLEAAFEVTFPRGPALNQSEQLFGTPLGASGNATILPRNGLMDLIIPCAPTLLGDGFVAPMAVELKVRSGSRPTGFALVTTREAVCGSPGACVWVFLSRPPAPAAASGLAPAVLYSIVGVSVAVVLAGVGGGVWLVLRSRAAAAGAGKASAAPKSAWGAPGDPGAVVVSLNPAAAAATSLNQGKEEGPPSTV